MAKQPQVKQPQLNVDLKSTTAILNSEGKNVFVSGVILRKNLKIRSRYR